MIPLTKKWFRAKKKNNLLKQKEVLENKIIKMIEVAKLEKDNKKHNIFKALVRRLTALDIELDQIKKQLKLY